MARRSSASSGNASSSKSDDGSSSRRDPYERQSFNLEEPTEEPKGAFEHTEEYRADAASLYDCFHEVNGENLFESFIGLCKLGISSQRPITFQ